MFVRVFLFQYMYKLINFDLSTKTKKKKKYIIIIKIITSFVYHLFQELKKVVSHTLLNDSELQLKKIYIERCKRLPAFGCNLYFVKEVQRGRTKTKVILGQYLSLSIVYLIKNNGNKS